MKARIILAAAAAAALSACTAKPDGGIDPVTAAQAVDRWQIEELMWRYARTLDTADADGYAAVYTEDGVFDAGTMRIEGREALHKFVADLAASRAERAAKGEPSGGTLHMVANHRIEFTGPDSALVHAYWLTAFPGSPPRVGAVGVSRDEVVRVNGQWLFKVRNVAAQD